MFSNLGGKVTAALFTIAVLAVLNRVAVVRSLISP